LRPSHRFCPNCGTPVGITPASQVGGPSLQVSREPSVDLSERRQLVTVLFADLSSSTELGEQLDAEDLRRVLTSFFDALAREIRRYGGTVDKYIGDAVMAVFGAPVAHGDDAERAISAAIAMQSAIGHLNHDLQQRFRTELVLRIGINTGEVIAGLLMTDLPAYTVVGDTVNTAHRLESTAPPGSILVGQATRDLTRRAFDFEPLQPRVLKGKSAPTAAFRVLGPRYDNVDPSAVPLIGRAPELARLREALARAAGGRGGLVHLVGDAGIGKSRLVRELRAGLPPETIQVVGRCVSFERDRPYALLARLIRDVVRVTPNNAESESRAGLEGVLAGLGSPVDARDTEVLLEVLGYGEHTTFEPRARQRVLLRLTRRLLLGYTERAPVVIIAEDLHWADAASCALLAELSRDIPSRRCLLLSSGRPGTEPAWPADVVPLEPLSETGALALIDLAFGEPVETNLARTLLERTGGNPFFIEEVARAARDANAMIAHADGLAARPGTSWRVPATLQEMLQARLDRLPAPAKRALQVAAVCGRVFHRRVLERLIPDLVRDDALGVLERESFVLTHAVQPEPTYSFRHALIQEVAYRSQLHTQQRVTHGAVAEALEAIYADRLDEVVADLAFHYGHSTNDAKAIHWLVRAGDRARALNANSEALASYEAALGRATTADQVHHSSELLERIGQVQTLVGRYDDALSSFRSALEQLPDGSTGALAHLYRHIGTALLLKGAYAEADRAFSAGLAVVSEQDDLESARLRVQIAQLYFRRGNYGAARSAMERAVDAATGLGADDLVAEGLKYLGNVAFHTGDLKGAAEHYLRSRTMYERLHNLSGIAEVRNNLGTIYRREARWDDAVAEYAACLALWERIGNPWGLAMSHNNIGEVERSRGDLGRAIASFEHAHAIFQSLGAATEAAIAMIGLGAARTELGDVAQGRVELLEAATRLEALGSTGYLPDAYRSLASAELSAHNLGAAERAADRALAYARAGTARHQEAATLRVLGEIALARGDAAAARVLLEDSRTTLAGLGDTLELARTTGVLAKLIEPPPA
jgi:class 3 adenylate cyclase/tetratricopeptide (TPR) repeat protein